MRRFVEEYLEQKSGVLRGSSFCTCIDMNSTEGIIAAVEAGLGVGVCSMSGARQSPQARKRECDPARQRSNPGGTLSIVLLNGPEPRGPLGQLLQILRDSGAVELRSCSRVPNEYRVEKD